MKKLLLALPLVCLCACSGGVSGTGSSDKAAPADRRQAWTEALKDSVDSLRASYDVCLEQGIQARERLAALLDRFEIVDDPMLVEQYRVAKGWRNYDTTGRQGVLARVLEDGTIEIVATTAGDFSSITLGAGGQSVCSSAVPAGNALHTSIGQLTRVAFNGSEPLAEFVAAHADESVTLTFSNGKSFRLSDAQKRMMADTWHFSTLMAEVNELERRESVIYNKLQLCQAKVAELEKQSDK